jgi:hypothetical protein
MELPPNKRMQPTVWSSVFELSAFAFVALRFMGGPLRNPAADGRAVGPQMALVTGHLDPDSSCQSQFIAYRFLSFVSSLIKRTVLRRVCFE